MITNELLENDCRSSKKLNHFAHEPCYIFKKIQRLYSQEILKSMKIQRQENSKALLSRNIIFPHQKTLKIGIKEV